MPSCSSVVSPPVPTAGILAAAIARASAGGGGRSRRGTRDRRDLVDEGSRRSVEDAGPAAALTTGAGASQRRSGSPWLSGKAPLLR
eukprot:7274627-Pyramimonas_sp.AAC.1